MHPIIYVSLGINAVNIIILAMLLFVFLRNFRHIRSSYNAGLIVFALVFLIENVLSMHLGIFAWPSYAATIISHIVLINVIQFFGLLVLFYITWK